MLKNHFDCTLFVLKYEIDQQQINYQKRKAYVRNSYA